MRVPVLSSPTHRSLAAGIASALAVATAYAAPAPGLEFSDGFLLGGDAIDMARYARGNPVVPGEYAVDVLLNGSFLEQVDITFIATGDPFMAEPCLPAALVERLGLKADVLDAINATTAACVDLPAHVEGATVSFDSSDLQLLVSVPQAARAQAPRGHVPADLRDPGIAAVFVDYSANHYRGHGVQNSYLGLRTGANLGAWRLRHRASFSHSPRGTRYTTLGTDLQRDLARWNSQLVLGQSTTGGELFESVRFSGARIATDERMLPDSLRGYAPVVQGVAQGNAVVTIRQNGAVIHESNVAPGPFIIQDLYPTSFGGDLEVTVTEADGNSERFTVNFSAVPQALRPGMQRFSATAGALREDDGRLQPLRFAEATYARGISNHLTALGGVQLAEGYQSALGGVAINTALGAFGADVTHSRARMDGQGAVQGNSYRFNYQRYFAGSGTNIGLAAYRYSTRGYRTLADVARLSSDSWMDTGRARQRYQMNFSQRLGERSSVHVSGGHVAYWDSSRRQNDLQLALQTHWRRANVSASVQRYRTGEDRQDTRYAINVSLPLGESASAPRLSSQVARADAGAQTQLGLNGSLGVRRAVNYSLSAGQDSGTGSSQSAYLGYQGSQGHFNAGYSRNGGQASQSFGGTGSVVLHRGGINIGPPLGNGFVLVQAKGAEGARVGSGHGVHIARNGYALVPHVSPYRWNRIELDPAGLPLDVALLQTSRRVAPTAGSVVRVAFDVRRERTLFIDATDALGQPLPFAATVTDEVGQPRGAVGQGGVIQLRDAQPFGSLLVDPDGPHRCRLDYQLPDAPDAYGLSWSQAVCIAQPPPPALLQVRVHQQHDAPPADLDSAATP